jgi:hypothetical protein
MNTYILDVIIKWKPKTYHTVITILKYHTVVTILKYHTVVTILRYHTRIYNVSNRLYSDAVDNLNIWYSG